MLRNIFSALLLLSTPVVGFGQPSIARLDEATKVFRLDGGNVTYAFGVNSREELQPLYWGGRLGRDGPHSAAAPAREWASFDSSYTNTPQEYAGWGAGLFMSRR